MSSHTSVKHPLIFISAAEPSADRHGAALISAYTKLYPQARFVGAGGQAMRDVGCECIFDMTQHAAMLLGVLGSARQGISLINTCGRHLRLRPFDAAVLIDSPMLHFPLASKAKAAGVPTLYYIAPQLWAWGSYRIYKVRHRVDKLATILPFEEKYFRDQGVNATYVGHPLVESLNAQAKNYNAFEIAKFQSTGDPVVALLPGSRKHVVAEVLKGQLEVAEQIASVHSRASFLVSSAGENVEPLIRQAVAKSSVRATVVSGHLGEILEASDLVLVASGTTALEVALHRRPMIVMYNASRLFYHAIGRWFINTPYLSLPNIIADREIVPEFMPYFSSTQPITDRALALLSSKETRYNMIAELDKIAVSLGHKQASTNTAQLLANLVSEKKH